TRAEQPVPGEPGKSTTSLRIFHGTRPHEWRRVGDWRPEISVGRERAAHEHAQQHTGQGRDHPDFGPYPNRFGVLPHVAPPLPDGDLDGDGVADVLVFRPG